MRRPELVAMTPMWPYVPPFDPEHCEIEEKVRSGRSGIDAQLQIVECLLCCDFTFKSFLASSPPLWFHTRKHATWFAAQRLRQWNERMREFSLHPRVEMSYRDFTCWDASRDRPDCWD